MANPYFRFKQFTIYHDRCAMKVTTDACLFGAWCATTLTGNKKSRILDIGTGTGLLSLMIAQQNKCSIKALEIDKLAAEQAQENVSNSPWDNQINIVNQDVRYLSGEQFNIIVSNPPFYEQELRGSNVQKNLAHHSLELSLKELIDSIDRLLEPNGNCYLLLPFKRREEFIKLLENRFFIQDSVLVRQSTRHEPFRCMISISREKAMTTETKISIWDDQQNYTPQFIDLLKDYYLYL